MEMSEIAHDIILMPPHVIYKVTCLCRVYATNTFRRNTRTRREEYNFPYFPRVFLSAGQIHGDDASPPPAKRPNDALCMRVCIRCSPDPVRSV